MYNKTTLLSTCLFLGHSLCCILLLRAYSVLIGTEYSIKMNNGKFKRGGNVC